MKRKAVRGVLSLAVLAAGFLVAAPAVAADKVSAADRLPENVYAYLTFPSIAEFKTQFKRSSVAGLRDEPALAEVWRELDAQFKKASAELDRELGITLEELLDVPTGEVALAYVHPAGKTPGGVSFVEFGKSRATVDKLLAKAREGLEKEGYKRETKEVGGTEIVIFSRGGEGEEPAGSKLKPSYFIKDETIVAATGPELLEEVLGRWDGSQERSFAGNKVFSYIVERTKVEDAVPAVRWYFNPIELVRSIVFSFTDGDPKVALAFGFLPALGLDKFEAMGGSGYFAVGPYESMSKTVVYIDMPPTGVLDMFRFPPADLKPPKWVPATAVSYFGMNWDLAKAYEALESLVDTFQGPGSFARTMDAVAMMEGGPKLHPKKDVIDQLTGEMHMVSEMPEGEQPGFLFAAGVKSADKMNEVLAKVAKTEGFPGQTREIAGVTIYEFEVPVAFNRVKAGVGVVQGHLMITNDVTTMLEPVIRPGDRRSLAEQPAYKKIAEEFPAQTSMISYARSDAQLKPIYEMVRSGGGGPGIKIRAEGFDFSKLPEFKVISKYLPLSGGYAVPDEHGAYFESFSVKPERTPDSK